MSAARRSAALVAAWLGVCLAGCAATIEPKAMIPELMPGARRHGQPVAVQVSGGRQSDPTGLPQISNEAFAEALSTAITKSQVFSNVVPSSGDARYVLKVYITAVQQPVMGGTLTVSMETGWQLEDRASGQVVWRKGVRSSHSATMGDAFAAGTRVRLATEGAARENIRAGLAQLAELELESQQAVTQ